MASTVRLRSASEYPESAQKLFDVAKAWFNHDFEEPSAMGRVMAWDQEFGGPHGRAPNGRPGRGGRGSRSC